METYFKAFSKIWSNTDLNRYEKDILITLIGFWNSYKKKHYTYFQKSYRDIMRLMGETDPHLIQKYVKKLEERGFLEITNIEDVQVRKHLPKFILKEENINVFFNGSFFPSTSSVKKRVPPQPQHLPSTQPFSEEKGQAEPEKREGAPPGRRSSLDYIANINKTITALKREQNGIQEERREQVAEKPAFLWDEL